MATPTPAQCSYLRSLLSQLPEGPRADTAEGLNAARAVGALTKQSASKIIDSLKILVAHYRANPLISLVKVQVSAQPEDAAVTAAAPLLTPLAAGRYAVQGRDGSVDLYKYDVPTQGKYAGQTYLKLLIGAPGSYREQRVSAQVKATIVARIQAAGAEESARLYGQTTSECGHCVSDLSDLQSRCSGYGRTCATKHGYWYATLPEARAWEAARLAELAE